MKKEQLNQALGLATHHQIFNFGSIVKYDYMEMFLLTYPLSTEKSLGETKISGNVWNYWYCCDVWAACVSAAGLAKAKHPFAMIPLHPYRNPMTYVLINDKKNTNKKEILKLGSLNIAKLQTKQIRFIYGNEKKIYENNYYSF